MKKKFIFLCGIIIFVAFVWLVTSIGIQTSLKKENNSSVKIVQQKIN